MSNLKMVEKSSHEFAIYLADQSPVRKDTAKRSSLERGILSSKVISTLTLALTLSGGITYFSKEKETKMKQILGKNIQDAKSSKQIIDAILKNPTMSVDE